MQFINAFLDILFPPRCEVCRSLGPDPFCPECRSQISYLKPSAFVHSIGIYEGALEKAIKRFKYRKKTRLAAPLGDIMAKYIRMNFDPKALDLLVPVPLHRKKLHERGFNQAELLASEISHHFGLPVIGGVLHRAKKTLPQFDLHPKERYMNVKGAFSVNSPDVLYRKRVLLVDDIYTTGSTIIECTKALKDAGASEVHVVTLSRAVTL